MVRKAKNTGQSLTDLRVSRRSKTCVIIAFDLLLYVKANFGVANIHSILKRNAKYKLE